MYVDELMAPAVGDTGWPRGDVIDALVGYCGCGCCCGVSWSARAAGRREGGEDESGAVGLAAVGCEKRSRELELELYVCCWARELCCTAADDMVWLATCVVRLRRRSRL